MYNKLFTKILDSSVWLESTPTRIVWLTFIAAMDETGFAQFAAVANVAHRARVSNDEAEAAIACLEGPDHVSPGQDHEGRRIERVPGGWMVLNAEKYRDIVTRAVQQQQTRERVRRFRNRVSSSNAVVTLGNGEKRDVTNANDLVTPSEAEAYTEAEEKRESTPQSKSNGHRKHTFCGDKFCVPMFLHEEFEKQLGSPGLERFDVFDWYQTLSERYAGIPIAGDVLAWIRREFKDATKELFADPKKIRANRVGQR